MLNPIQQQKVEEIKTANSHIGAVYDEINNLCNRILTEGLDNDVSLTTTQISVYITKYNLIRQSMVDKANALPII